jgi:hypothetical protein
MEAAAFCAADGKAGKASPSSGFISWTAEGEAFPAPWVDSIGDRSAIDPLVNHHFPIFSLLKDIKSTIFLGDNYTAFSDRPGVGFSIKPCDLSSKMLDSSAVKYQTLKSEVF